MKLKTLIFCIIFFYSLSVNAMLEFAGVVSDLLKTMHCANSDAIRTGQNNTKVIYIFNCKEKSINNGFIECDNLGCNYIEEK